jgi:hypothetical protein
MLEYDNNPLLLPGNLVEAIIERAEDYNRLISSGEDRPRELLDSISSLKDEIDELKASLEMWDWFDTCLVTSDTEEDAIEATLQMYGDRFGDNSRSNLENMLRAFLENK